MKHTKKKIKKYQTGGEQQPQPDETVQPQLSDPVLTQQPLGGLGALAGPLSILAAAIPTFLTSVYNNPQDQTNQLMMERTVDASQGFTFQEGGGQTGMIPDIRGMEPLYGAYHEGAYALPGTGGKYVSDTQTQAYMVDEIQEFGKGGKLKKMKRRPIYHYAYGGVSNGGVVQATKGEMMSFADGHIVPVRANRTHKQMDDDEVTDVMPEGGYIYSADKKMRIKRDEAEDVLFGYTPVSYGENEYSGTPPKEITLADEMGSNKKLTPAELAKAIKARYKVTDHQDDPFAEFARRENLASRVPRLQALKMLNEKKKPKRERENPEQFNWGGAKKAQEGMDYTKLFAALREDADRMNKQNRGLALGMGAAGVLGPVAALGPIMSQETGQAPIDMLQGLETSIPQSAIDYQTSTMRQSYRNATRPLLRGSSDATRAIQNTIPFYDRTLQAQSQLAGNVLEGNRTARNQKRQSLFEAMREQRLREATLDQQKGDAAGAAFSNIFSNVGASLGQGIGLNRLALQDKLSILGAELEYDTLKNLYGDNRDNPFRSRDPETPPADEPQSNIRPDIRVPNRPVPDVNYSPRPERPNHLFGNYPDVGNIGDPVSPGMTGAAQTLERLRRLHEMARRLGPTVLR